MPRKQNKPSHVTKGNIFDDLGFRPHEAAALKVKATILNALLEHVRQRHYTQVQLAEILGDYQPNISQFLNGKISKMSIEKLLHYATRLNMDTHISVKAKARSAKKRVA
ncbi:MAG TPA: helix-turn-helix transcriptional regulator [Candidatus Angelobacter sp.]|jgi:predicted XRE-type DNA-binding protein|nr:helix-turn-helix transcriptional regulator [Candidatus Angelobacter sp.]